MMTNKKIEEMQDYINKMQDSINKIRELTVIACDYNQNDKLRTELSQKCITYLVDVDQTLTAIKWKLIKDCPSIF